MFAVIGGMLQYRRLFEPKGSKRSLPSRHPRARSVEHEKPENLMQDPTPKFIGLKAA
jgi:hypothetical protein